MGNVYTYQSNFDEEIKPPDCLPASKILNKRSIVGIY